MRIRAPENAPCHHAAKMRPDRNASKVVAEREMDAVTLADVWHEVEGACTLACPGAAEFDAAEIGQDRNEPFLQHGGEGRRRFAVGAGQATKEDPVRIGS